MTARLKHRSVRLAAMVALALCNVAFGGPVQHVRAQSAKPDESLYQLGTRLIDQDGKRVGLDVFRGAPVIISMFYGTCKQACPVLLGKIEDIQAQLPVPVRDKTRVLLVSLDGRRDTQQALRHLASMHKFDLKRWRLATASEPATRELATVLGVRYSRLPNGTINHSSVITLLDQQGTIALREEGLNADTSKIVAKLRELAAK